MEQTGELSSSQTNIVDINEVAENIRKVVNKTATCVKQGLSLTGFTMKETCIYRGMMQEASKLINEITENAA